MNDVQSVFSMSKMALAAYSTLSADMEKAQYQAALEQGGNGMTSLQAARLRLLGKSLINLTMS